MTTSASWRRTSSGSMAPASQTRALATAQARAWRMHRLGVEAGEPGVDQAGEQAVARADRVDGLDRRGDGPVASASADRTRTGPGPSVTTPHAHAVPRPVVEQAEDVGVGRRVGPAEVGGGLAAVELDDVGPEAPDRLEGRAVGVEEDRHPPRPARAIRSLYRPWVAGRGARPREGQGLDAPLGRAPPRPGRSRASASAGVIAGSGSKKAVWSGVPSVRTVRMTRVGASVGVDQRVEPVVVAGAGPRNGRPTGPPRNVTGRAVRPSRVRARATLFPLPPTTSRTARPAHRVAGLPGGDRQGLVQARDSASRRGSWMKPS